MAMFGNIVTALGGKMTITGTLFGVLWIV